MASRVLATTDDMGRVRGWLVRRRACRVIGEYWTDLAVESPYDDNSWGATLAPALKAGYEADKAGRSGDATDGLLHRALCKEPGHPLLSRLDESSDCCRLRGSASCG